MSVLLRPGGDEVAKGFGSYMTEQEVRALVSGDKFEVLCEGGIHYVAKVVQIDGKLNGQLHFWKWNDKFDYFGSFKSLYLASVGTYSTGTLNGANQYIDPSMEPTTQKKSHSKATEKEEGVLTYAEKSRYDDDYLFKPYRSDRKRRSMETNSNSLGEQVEENEQPQTKKVVTEQSNGETENLNKSNNFQKLNRVSPSSDTLVPPSVSAKQPQQQLQQQSHQQLVTSQFPADIPNSAAIIDKNLVGIHQLLPANIILPKVESVAGVEEEFSQVPPQRAHPAALTPMSFGLNYKLTIRWRQYYCTMLENREEKEYKDIAAAMKWLDKNLDSLRAKGTIKGKVHGPIGSMFTARDHSSAIVIEQCISKDILLSFLVDRLLDQAYLQDVFENKLGLCAKVLFSGTRDRFGGYKPIPANLRHTSIACQLINLSDVFSTTQLIRNLLHSEGCTSQSKWFGILDDGADSDTVANSIFKLLQSPASTILYLSGHGEGVAVEVRKYTINKEKVLSERVLVEEANRLIFSYSEEDEAVKLPVEQAGTSASPSTAFSASSLASSGVNPNPNPNPNPVAVAATTSSSTISKVLPTAVNFLNKSLSGSSAGMKKSTSIFHNNHHASHPHDTSIKHCTSSPADEWSALGKYSAQRVSALQGALSRVGSMAVWNISAGGAGVWMPNERAVTVEVRAGVFNPQTDIDLHCDSSNLPHVAHIGYFVPIESFVEMQHTNELKTIRVELGRTWPLSTVPSAHNSNLSSQNDVLFVKHVPLQQPDICEEDNNSGPDVVSIDNDENDEKHEKGKEDNENSSDKCEEVEESDLIVDYGESMSESRDGIKNCARVEVITQEHHEEQDPTIFDNKDLVDDEDDDDDNALESIMDETEVIVRPCLSLYKKSGEFGLSFESRECFLKWHTTTSQGGEIENFPEIPVEKLAFISLSCIHSDTDNYDLRLLKRTHVVLFNLSAPVICTELAVVTRSIKAHVCHLSATLSDADKSKYQVHCASLPVIAPSSSSSSSSYAAAGVIGGIPSQFPSSLFPMSPAPLPLSMLSSLGDPIPIYSNGSSSSSNSININHNSGSAAAATYVPHSYPYHIAPSSYGMKYFKTHLNNDNTIISLQKSLDHLNACSADLAANNIDVESLRKLLSAQLQLARATRLMLK